MKPLPPKVVSCDRQIMGNINSSYDHYSNNFCSLLPALLYSQNIFSKDFDSISLCDEVREVVPFINIEILYIICSDKALLFAMVTAPNFLFRF